MFLGQRFVKTTMSAVASVVRVPPSFPLSVTVTFAPPLSMQMARPLSYKAHEKSRSMQKLINKRGAKTKRYWYKPHLGEPLEVETKKSNPKKGISVGHSIRLRQHGHVLYDKITEIINTGELSQDILEKQVTITAVEMARDMNTANVYWEADRDDWEEVEPLLAAHCGKLRSILISYHVLGRIPHIVFVKNKAGVNLSQLSHLFEKADYGPDYIPGVIRTDIDSEERMDLLEHMQDDQDHLRLQELGENDCDSSSSVTNDDVSYLNNPDYLVEDKEENDVLKNNQKEFTTEKEEIMSFADKLKRRRRNISSSSINSDLSSLKIADDTNINQRFRSDLYGLHRDDMMKKILAKISLKSHHNSYNVNKDTDNSSASDLKILENVNHDPAISSLKFDVDPKGVPSLVSPALTKQRVQQKQARQERRLKEQMLQRDSVDF